MKSSVGTLIIAACIAVSLAAIAALGAGKISKWNKSKEAALRSLIAKEDVTLELYYGEGKLPLPLHRLYVPESFVELYKASPVDCLTVLASIVERGNSHDALVAFQFGMAGDELQAALPLFHYLDESTLDKPFAKDETYRQCCLRMIQDQLDDQKQLRK